MTTKGLSPDQVQAMTEQLARLYVKDFKHSMQVAAETTGLQFSDHEWYMISAHAMDQFNAWMQAIKEPSHD